MSKTRSCIGCKFFYADGSGYSNYTWEETTARCALGKNKAFEEKEWEIPCDMATNPAKDEWEPTRDGRCKAFKPGEHIVLDPDRECWGRGFPGSTTPAYWESEDQEQLDAIWSHQKAMGSLADYYLKPEIERKETPHD